MSQILHIFRKDVRRHWIEILLCQAALALYCWDAVSSWREQPSLGFNFGLTMLSTAKAVLLPLTWGFLIFRIVQGESLVGDRQFWVTRPYEWKKLLAAKVLLLLTFLNLPLLVAGAVLLAKAGFSPAPHVPGLLWMQLLLAFMPFLPLFTFASVTRNLAQGALGLLALAVFGAGMAALDSVLTEAGFSSGDTDWMDGTVLVIVCLAVIGLQYARRKTGQSRIWLASGALAFMVIELASLHRTQADNLYPLPAAGQTTSFHAELDPVKLEPPKKAPEKDENVEIRIPLRAWGVPEGSLARIRGVKLTLQAADGFRWDSDWGWAYQLLWPGENKFRQDFTIKHKIYERLRPGELKARIAVAVEVLREPGTQEIMAARGEFVVPRVGRCRIEERRTYSVLCHSPLVKPFTMVVVRVDPATSTCPLADDEDQKPPPAGIPYTWEQGSDTKIAEYGVSPVESFSFYFRNAHICPGTPLTFSFPEFVENTRSDFEINRFNLDEYRASGFIFAPGMFRIAGRSR